MITTGRDCGSASWINYLPDLIDVPEIDCNEKCSRFYVGKKKEGTIRIIQGSLYINKTTIKVHFPEHFSTKYLKWSILRLILI